MQVSPAEGEQDLVCPRVPGLSLYTCPFRALFSAMSFSSLRFLLLILLFKMARKSRAEAVWCLEVRGAVVCLWRTHVC